MTMILNYPNNINHKIIGIRPYVDGDPNISRKALRLSIVAVIPPSN